MTQDLLYEQIPINFGFYLEKTLDNFIIGNNQDLYKSLISVGDINQLILIYGSKSSGKSHIAEAMMHLKLNDCIQINQNTNFDDISLSDFYDLVVIDDIDKIISNQKNEEILFTLIDNQILHKKSSVVTSTADIDNCSITLRDLTSRLQSDKIFNINDLDKLIFYDFRIAIQPKNIVGKDLVLHLIEEDIYLSVKFKSWSQGQKGGFSYERSTMSN